MVVLTGDIHTSWAVNLKNGNTPVGVEMVTPSVTSPGVPINLSGLITLQNPDIKYVELTKRGFMLVDITGQRVQGDWYNVNTIDQMNPGSTCVKSYVTNNGSNELILANTAATGHGAFNQELLGPCSRFYVALAETTTPKVIGVYPNPSNDFIKLQTLNLSPKDIHIYSADGKQQQVSIEVSDWENGLTIVSLDVQKLMPGSYTITIEKGKTQSFRFEKTN
jgi:alkaline phosphatase D